MAEASQPGASSSAAAAQPASTNAPIQPPTSHQQPQQTTQAPATVYAQYPNAYGQAYAGYNQYGTYPAGYVQPAQPQQAYAQAAYPQAAYPQAGYPQAVPPPVVQETKFRIYFKCGLHAAAVVLALVSLGLGLGLLAGDEEIKLLAAVAVPIPIIAILWSGAELMVRKIHKFESGIHPGGQVAMCLILWLLTVIMSPIEWIYGISVDSYCSGYYNDVDSEQSCYNPWGNMKGMWWAISTFSSLLFVIYFTLFIIACIDTAKRNAAKRVIMVMNPATYWGPPAQGWQPMPQDNNVPIQQQGHYMTVPAAARTRGSNASEHQGQDIQLQNRTPSPATPYETPMETIVDEKGKGPEVAGSSNQQGNHGVQEFYTPSGR